MDTEKCRDCEEILIKQYQVFCGTCRKWKYTKCEPVKASEDLRGYVCKFCLKKQNVKKLTEPHPKDENSNIRDSFRENQWVLPTLPGCKNVVWIKIKIPGIQS